MSESRRHFACARALLLGSSLLAAPAAAQESPPAPGTYPPPTEPAPQQQAYPAPGQQPTYSDPEPTYAPPEQQGYESSYNYQQSYPPPTNYSEPSASSGSRFEMPPWSVRLDPFNWLLEGRLGLELEVGLLDFLSVELVPVFVVNSQPPTLNFSGIEDTLYQHSNGLGALAGSSIGVGFWLGGKAFQGYVLRAILTNYGYRYETKDRIGKIDEVTHTERHFYGYIGSQSRWGAFTIAGGIGLGVELNKEQRCFSDRSVSSAQTSGCLDDDEQLIALDRDVARVADLNSPFHPVQLMARFSLGIVID